MSHHADRTFKRIVDVDGVEREIEIHLKHGDLEIRGDLLTETSRMASLVGLCGDLISEWKKGAELADADYRNFRGRRVNELLTEDPKMAEWKVKEAVDATEGCSAESEFEIDGQPCTEDGTLLPPARKGFKDHKRIIADINADLEWLERHWQALLVKRDMIKARVALEVKDRIVAGDIGDTVPSRGNPSGRPAAAPASRSRDQAVIEASESVGSLKD